MIHYRFRLHCLIILLFCFVAIVPSSAQISTGKNHFKLHWRRFETDHFEIIYHAGLDSVAVLSATFAERQYARVTQTLGITPPSKTPVILINTDDISNGLANPLNHSIMIWVPSPVKLVSDSSEWLERVIGHEFGHIVTYWGARNGIGLPWELLTLGMTPVWYLEGVAQYSAETWDIHRDLLLRNAFTSDAVLPRNQMNGFMGTDQLDARLLYEQGHGLIRYISGKYGEDKIGRIIRYHRKFPWSFSHTLKQTLGKSMKSLYREWFEATEAAYCRAIEDKNSGRQTGREIATPFAVVAGVRMSAQGQLAIAAEDRWDEGVPRLYIQENSEWKQVSGSYAGGSFSWSPDGKSLVYSRMVFGENGSVIHDLYRWDKETREHRLTRNLRAGDPVWSPKRDEICFVRQQSGRSNLYLLDLKTLTCSPVTQFKLGTDVFSPSWSPDGENIAFSLVEPNGKRDIAIIHRNGSHLKKLTDDLTDDRSPAWSHDGAWIAYCTYENGTPNLCQIRVDGSERATVTHLAGGVFNPAWSADDREIFAPVFEDCIRVAAYAFPAHDREFPIDRMIRPPWAETAISLQASVRQGAGDNPESALQISGLKDYHSLGHLRPLLGLPFFGTDDGGLQYGAIAYAADPLFLHQCYGFATVGRRVNYLMNYQNQQLGADLDIQVSGLTSDRGAFLGLDHHRLWERRNLLSITGTIPLFINPDLMHYQALQIFGSFETIRSHESRKFQDLQSVFRPFQGQINRLGIGVVRAWSQPDIASDIHPMSGASVRLLFSMADPKWGSDLEQRRVAFSGARRFEMPWRRHILAFRTGGLIQWGDQPVQDLMSLNVNNVRALSWPFDGDRFLYGAVEYRMNLIRNIGLEIPLLYFERTTAAFWTDAGKAWGRQLYTYKTGERLPMSQTDWLITAGVELRQRIWLIGRLAIVVRGGAGWDFLADEANTYVLLGPVF